LEREKLEGVANTDANTHITIETGFECSPKMEVHEISPTHFALQVPSPQWFMFRAHGVAGKTVRFDMVNPGVGLPFWSTLNPVYTYATDLDSPATYDVDQSAEAGAGEKAERAWNGALLPSTSGQQWHFISNSWEESVNQFSFVQRFDSEDAVIAMRVPHPPGYNERFFAGLASNPHAKVVEIGRSTQNRPLFLAQIGGGSEGTERQKPCILIYAGEHADEQDAMWVATGAISYLCADSTTAKALRSRFGFLVIPMLDPDAAAAGAHSAIMQSFISDLSTPESVQYADWAQNWINSGNRLDLVFDLHNVQSKEAPSVSCALMESVGLRGQIGDSLNALVIRALVGLGYSARPTAWMRGWSPDRLGGWLSRRYGTITIAYECNGQAPNAHLDEAGIKKIAVGVANALPAFFGSPSGIECLAEVDSRRKERRAKWAIHGPVDSGVDALQGEAAASADSGIASTSKEVGVERYVP
jgi:hypothetical protein